MSGFIPSSEGAKFISDEFFKIAKNRKAFVVNFEEDKAPGDCGMVACHGGWATEFDGFKEWSEGQNCTNIVFLEGAEYLAHLLGFDYQYYFRIWAQKNPKLWGAEYGHCMFDGNGYYAFGFTEETKDGCTLDFIARWYADFSERLKGLESAN